MNKLEYYRPVIAITFFNNEDIIKASYAQITTELDDDSIELPFVPIKPKNIL